MVLFGGMMCPFYMNMGYDSSDMMLCFGVKVVLLIWVIAVPIIITSRLDKIVKLLQDKK